MSFFTSKISAEDARKVVDTGRQDIAAIYNLSELSNLRILQQTMWDFERLLSARPLIRRPIEML